MRGATLAIVAALGAGGCRQALGIPGDFVTPGCADGEDCFSVSGRVTGASRTSETVAIHLGDFESVTPTADGTFTFEYGIADHAPYLVTASPNCFVVNEQGLVDGAGVDNVEVFCDGLVSFDPLMFSAPLELDPAYSPAVEVYNARASLLTQQLSVVARPTYETGVVTQVLLGERALQPAGDDRFGPITAEGTSLFIDLDEPTWGNLRYEIRLDTTEVPAEFGYGKAPASEPRARFGSAVASDGDITVVGSPLAPGGGRVTIFRRTNRSWMMERELQAPVPSEGDQFGASVAIAGSTIVIGAPNSGAGKGAAYTSTASASGWSNANALVSPASASGDRFGAAVAIAGPTIVVGAPGASAGAGRAFVFGGTPVTLVAPNAGSGDRFGTSVAVSGSRIAVGAPGEDSLRSGIQLATPLEHDELYSDAGAVYVFAATGAFEAFVKPVGTSAGDEFGAAVALGSDLLAVGAPLADFAAPAGGAAYLFDVTPWIETTRLGPPAANAMGDNFGRTIAIAGNVLAVGAPYEDSADEAVLDTGAAYLYPLTAATPGDPKVVRASRADSGDFFGAALALTLDCLVVGAPFEDSASDSWNGNQGNGAGDSGAVYAFR